MTEPVRHVTLNRREADYLLRAAFLPQALLPWLQQVQWPTGQAGTLLIPEAAAEAFRDAFTEQLARAGFDENYAPNAEGRLLEALIDRFLPDEPVA